MMMTSQKGTPLYAAPEVFLNEDELAEYSSNCDVWAGGLILYEMLTGSRLMKHVNVTLF